VSGDFWLGVIAGTSGTLLICFVAFVCLVVSLSVRRKR
jgi:hypothetical protein